ncbi:MAG: DUF488 domain-containing protein [Rhodospirillaceae bacterium]|nr:DUF488 domain-containing protein [Rhodospirillaceae bacterium]
MADVFTIGHSTRDADAFMALLGEAGVRLLADVRRFPRSRRHPQFNADRLAATLAAADIGYRHFPALGGRRTPQEASPNTLWTEPGFRGYADYAATPEFRAALDALEGLARATPTAIMCAEAAWWRCHRRIIADYLIADGFSVHHVLAPGRIEPARLTEGARRRDDRTLVYPAGARDGHAGDLFDGLREDS